LFGAVFRNPASISFCERATESSGFKIPAVSRRSGLLPPGVVQITTVNRVEAKIVNEAKRQRKRASRRSRPPTRSGSPVLSSSQSRRDGHAWRGGAQVSLPCFQRR